MATVAPSDPLVGLQRMAVQTLENVCLRHSQETLSNVELCYNYIYIVDKPMAAGDSDSFSFPAPQQSPLQPQPDDCEASEVSVPQQSLLPLEPQQSLDWVSAGAPQQSDLPVGRPTAFLINLTSGFSFCVDMGFWLMSLRAAERRSRQRASACWAQLPTGARHPCPQAPFSRLARCA
jgi:hypothetical protein